MTTPNVTPSKAKAWWAVIGGLLGSLVPIGAQIAGVLPAPWGPLLTGIIGVIALGTGAAVHQAPYMPPDTAIVPTVPVVPPAAPGRHTNPFRQ